MRGLQRTLRILFPLLGMCSPTLLQYPIPRELEKVILSPPTLYRSEEEMTLTIYLEPIDSTADRLRGDLLRKED